LVFVDRWLVNTSLNTLNINLTEEIKWSLKSGSLENRFNLNIISYGSKNTVSQTDWFKLYGLSN